MFPGKDAVDGVLGLVLVIIGKNGISKAWWFTFEPFC